VPNHKEVNPALFTIVTFPFLFGVMYGDVGHGSLVLMFAIYLCLFQTKGLHNSKDMNSLVANRYILLMMGFFAVFSGLIYNEFFAFPLNLLGSCYPDLERKEDCVY
jgi:V-type H+-transporting ATPase subunit a